jgi:hypothetical protein
MPLIQLLHRIASRSYLPEVTSASAEHRKLNILRIVVGLIFLVRHLLIFAPYFALRDVYKLHPWEGGLTVGGTTFKVSVDAPIGLTLLILIAYICFTIGLFTPVAVLVLICLASIYDSYFMADVIGLDMQVFVLCLLGFFLAKTGSHYSVDGWLLRARWAWPKRALSWLYGGPALPDAQLLRVIYFAMFAAYGLVSLSAGLLHLEAPHWRDGSLIGDISVNPTYNPTTHELFAYLRDHLPSLFWAYSVFGGGSQLFWELAMLGLIFNKYGKHFVIWQGIGFFTICALTLSLKALPYVEFVLWAMLFWRAKPRATDMANNDGRQMATAGKPGRLILTTMYLLSLHVVFFLVNFPLFIFKYQKDFTKHKMADYLRYVALPYPEVFNERISMPIGFSVLYRKKPDSASTLVPFRQPDGGRLLFDRFPSLYFGQIQFAQNNHEMLMLLDYQLNGLSGDVTYVCERYNGLLKGSPVKLSKHIQVVNFAKAKERFSLANGKPSDFTKQIEQWFQTQLGPQDSAVIFEARQPGAVDLPIRKLLANERYQLFATPPGHSGPVLAPPVWSGWQELLEWPNDTTKILKIRQLVPKTHRVFMLWNGNLNAPGHPQVQYLYNIQDKVLIAEIGAPAP